MGHLGLFHHVLRPPGATGHGGPAFYAVALVAIGVEAIWRLRVAHKGYAGLAAAATLGLAAGNLVFGVVNALGLAAVFSLAYRVAPIHWPLDDWRTWAVGFVAVEFAYYWFHRLSHEVRWMWATHSVHHTPEQITFLSSIRLGWTNLFSAAWVVYLPLVLAGFDPRLVFGLLALDLNYQFFLHTEAKVSFGPLELILNTPAHHRVHHASNPSYLDRNYGGVVILFDRLFGTFAAERPDDTLRYGLVHPTTSKNPLRLAFGEWRRLFGDMARAQSPLAAIKVALGPPG